MAGAGASPQISRATDTWRQAQASPGCPSHPKETGREGAHGSWHRAGSSVHPCPRTSHQCGLEEPPLQVGSPDLSPVGAASTGRLHPLSTKLLPPTSPFVCPAVPEPLRSSACSFLCPGAGLRAGGVRAAPLTQTRAGPDVNLPSLVTGDCATGKAQRALAFALGCRWGRGVGAPLYCLLPPTLEMSSFFVL